MYLCVLCINYSSVHVTMIKTNIDWKIYIYNIYNQLYDRTHKIKFVSKWNALWFSCLALAFSSGIPRQISLSNLPARLRAGSSESGRLVEPITNTWASSFLFKSINQEVYCIMLLLHNGKIKNLTRHLLINFKVFWIMYPKIVLRYKGILVSRQI